MIASNVLSSLVAYEKLYMENSCVEWEVEGLNNKRNNASLAELKNLSHIRDANNLPKYLTFEKLEEYVIFVRDAWDWTSE